MKKRKRRVQLVAVLVLVAAMVAVAAQIQKGVAQSILLGLIYFLSMVLILMVTNYSRRSIWKKIKETREYLRQGQRNDFHQIESLLSIYNTLQVSQPLPESRGWAGSPDFLKLVMENVLMQKPRLVLEASSGFSTLIIAHALKRNGSGKVYSLENDAHYAEVTRKRVAMHGLGEHVAVITAPLKEYSQSGSTSLWYGVEPDEIPGGIELVVVDGPPGISTPLARYPLFDVLKEKVSSVKTVILDDADRADEKETAERWAKEHGFSAEHYASEKGTLILRR